MTSRQLQRKLTEAIEIIAKCERVFDDPEKAARRMDDVEAKQAIDDFMAEHRADLANGGQP